MLTLIAQHTGHRLHGFLPTKTSREANITRLMAELHIKTYSEFHAWSVANRDTFWQMMINVLGR